MMTIPLILIAVGIISFVIGCFLVENLFVGSAWLQSLLIYLGYIIFTIGLGWIGWILHIKLILYIVKLAKGV